MSFIEQSEQNVDRLMKEVSGGGVAGFVGGRGMGIDALFAGPYHPDYNEVDKLLKKQLKDRKKQRADMEKETDDYTGTSDPVGGYYEIDTEFVRLAYDELIKYNKLNKQYSDEMTPIADIEWKSTGWDYDCDEPGEAYKIKDIVYDDKPTYAGVNFINQSETNMENVGIDIQYDDKPTYAGENFINKSEKNWELIKGI